jgi:thiol-disulfide isomerase/thioredoxin
MEIKLLYDNIYNIIKYIIYIYNMSNNLYDNNSDVIELTEKDFNVIKLTSKPLLGKFGLIKCYANWCPHCKDKVEKMEYLAQGLKKDNFFVAAVNTENCRNLSNNLGVEGIPVFFFVDDKGNLEKLNIKFTLENILMLICEKTSKCYENNCDNNNKNCKLKKK